MHLAIGGGVCYTIVNNHPDVARTVQDTVHENIA